MPLGGLLAETIAADAGFEFHRPGVLTKGDVELYTSLRSHVSADKVAGYTAAGPRLAAAITSSASVDDALYLLSEYPEAVELGEICIVHSILRAEHNSTLRVWPDTGRMKPDAGKDGWIEQMFSMAIANCKLSKVQDSFKNVTFINFNYDRCLEHYLYWSLQRIGVPEEDAKGIIASLSIIRPYGTLGSILPGKPDTLSFGNAAPFNGIKSHNRIRTFTEDTRHRVRAVFGLIPLLSASGAMWGTRLPSASRVGLIFNRPSAARDRSGAAPSTRSCIAVARRDRPPYGRPRIAG